VNLTDAEIALALRNPLATREHCVRRVWPEEVIARVGAAELPIRVVPPAAPLRVPAATELWSGPAERIVSNTSDDLIRLLNEFRPDAVETHVALMSKDAMRLYLRMNVVRVVRLVEQLRRRGVEPGRVLEVGAWFGSFALALRRLGYDVVACDRYESYGEAFAAYTDLMLREGVEVVSTARATELDEIGGLGSFDAVFAAAVIEHVPHTPRPLLEALFGAVRPGGVLLLDTPNVARYWNRQTLERGETIFQPIMDQYDTTIPWEGHHREYTAAELRWLLERVGCVEVEAEWVDYNMLQFEELTIEHTDCLARIVEDPSQSDIVLVSGRRPPG
jgi:2-polyprenyl-3-methyl-5-hydroxy-6-metoxy-1,4-benzoquinol methylase